MEVRGLDHVGLHVADPERSRMFYVDVLGLREIARPDLGFAGHWLALADGRELHLIGKHAQPHLAPRERHYALGVSAIEAWARHLRERRVPFDGPRRRADGARQIFLRDPDGHVVELVERAP